MTASDQINDGTTAMPDPTPPPPPQRAGRGAWLPWQRNQDPAVVERAFTDTGLRWIRSCACRSG
ncbi:MAG TPA: hypothetical protein VE673_19790 [Pseudonocardiaceae bacterium]|nr:hypothetical protein [Pseudonocardiaceae bacterium]